VSAGTISRTAMAFISFVAKDALLI